MASRALEFDRPAPPAPRPSSRPTPPVALVPQPSVQPRREPEPARAFDVDLPPGLFRLMFGLLGLFLAILFANFAEPGMGIIGVICAVCLLGYFGVPYALHRAAPADPAEADRTIGGLLARGMDTGEGHRTEGHEAIGLVLLLPVIMVVWAIAVSLIRASLL